MQALDKYFATPPRNLSRRSSLAIAAISLGFMAQPASAQIVLAGFSFDDNAGPDRAVPTPGSNPEFDGQLTGCSVMQTLPGKTLDESLTTVMLSDSVDNWVRGRAAFRLDFEDNAIVNLPGPDVVVFELGDAENFDMRVFFEDTLTWSSAQTISVVATGFNSPCPAPNSINAVTVDLSLFGVLPGAKVRSLLLDNKGAPGSTSGADLIQIMALNSTAPLPGKTRLLSFQQGIAGLSNVAYANAADTGLAGDAPNLNWSTSPLQWVDASPEGNVLMRFDSIIGTAVGQIPPGAKILSASLHFATGASPANSSGSHRVHQILQPWDASTITYASGFGGNGVDADDVESSLLPTAIVSPMGTNATQSVSVTQLVQAWVDGTPNWGVAFQTGSSDGLGLHMSEATIATLRPALSVVIESYPWDDLGGSLAGSNGVPHLAATGVLAENQNIEFEVSNGVSSGQAIFVLGTGVLNAPFMGGLFVPLPQVVVPGLPLDGFGSLLIPGSWPNGVPAGIDIVVQFWIPDVGGPLGFAATNARRAVTE